MPTTSTRDFMLLYLLTVMHNGVYLFTPWFHGTLRSLATIITDAHAALLFAICMKKFE
jgi:hypothetical protein